MQADTDGITVTGRAIFLVFLMGYSVKFIFSPLDGETVSRSFLHLVNLPFHEAGHIIFLPFGRFMSVLGGSLMQLLVPVVCLIAFLFQQGDKFGASVALWWFGESLMDLAPYIGDARALRLILLGGVTGRDVQDYHDWQYLLRETGLLMYDRVLAWTAHISGIVVILIALLWGALVIATQVGRLRRAGSGQEE